MKGRYSADELAQLAGAVRARRGWDFSRMSVDRQPVPWSYPDVVRRYLTVRSRVLDVGTGGGEQLMALASSFRAAIGVDIDPVMVAAAADHASGTSNLRFQVSTEQLESVHDSFDVVLARHAPVGLKAVWAHLANGGYLITQQVGERNMANVRDALGQRAAAPPLSRDAAAVAGLVVIAFAEYDVEYVVHDVESLVFWLSALDLRHADLPGGEAVASVEVFNEILRGNIDHRGFVTNEHRYLMVAQRINPKLAK